MATLTRDSIMAMEPGQDLDWLIADLIMGWVYMGEPGYWHDRVTGHRTKRRFDSEDYYDHEPHWSPSTDWNDAWDVIAMLSNRLYSRGKLFLAMLQEASTPESMRQHGQRVAWPDALWLMTPFTICRAALLTFKVEEDQGLRPQEGTSYLAIVRKEKRHDP